MVCPRDDSDRYRVFPAIASLFDRATRERRERLSLRACHEMNRNQTAAAEWGIKGLEAFFIFLSHQYVIPAKMVAKFAYALTAVNLARDALSEFQTSVSRTETCHMPWPPVGLIRNALFEFQTNVSESETCYSVSVAWVV